MLNNLYPQYLCTWNNATNDDQPVCKIPENYRTTIEELSTLSQNMFNYIFQNMYIMGFEEEQTCSDPSKWDIIENAINHIIPVGINDYHDNGNETFTFSGLLFSNELITDSKGTIIPYPERYDLLHLVCDYTDNSFYFRCHITHNYFYQESINYTTYNFFRNKMRTMEQYNNFIRGMHKFEKKLNITRDDLAEENRNIAINAQRLNMDNRIFSHGLTAFNNGDPNRNLHKITDSIDGEIQEMEICCSTPNKPIGLMGIFVKGRVIMASCTDLYTEISYDNQRVFDNIDYFAPAFSYSQLWKKHSGRGGDNCNNEIILIPEEITGIWVKEYAGIETKEDAQIMADRLNVSLSIVKPWRLE
ncbi:MAG TPA: hypothetical protein DEG71_09870 [Clostridiales bacterium]|nr:hypothetical protein [Clostridiales bacterium]